MPNNWNKLVTIQEAAAAYAAGDDLDAHCFLYAGDRVKPYRETVSGDIITLPPYDPPLTLYTETGRYIESLIANINPVQDLHGYDQPWPAGGGKNLFYSENNLSYTVNGVTATFDAETQMCTLNGTNTGTSAYIVLTIPITSDIPRDTPLSRAFLPTSKGMYINFTYRKNGTWYGINNGESIPSDTDADSTLRIQVGIYASATSFNNVKFNIQVEKGATPTSYAPYSNICPISGWTDANIHVSPTIYNITFPTEAGTVYGGQLDVTTGVLTVTDAMITSYNGEALPSTWISDRDVYEEGATPTTGAQVVYKLAEPQTYQLIPTEIPLLNSETNIFADTGAITLTYVETREVTNE